MPSVSLWLCSIFFLFVIIFIFFLSMNREVTVGLELGAVIVLQSEAEFDSE